VEELSSAVDNLQVYCNTLHEEVHVLYSQLHPNVPVDPFGMEAGCKAQNSYKKIIIIIK
jgi:hypothetical protein